MQVASTIAVLALISAVVAFANPARVYLWVKAAHVVSIIAWMAGMLYLPRLFVYHSDVEPGSPQSETFKVMERRLLKAILTPAMIATWVLGLWLIHILYPIPGAWIWVKVACVIALTGLHGYFAGAVRRFARDENTRPARHWRIMNEVPTLLMIVIVVMVVVKPF
nr:protoporphyrinogen oxidase HemJ [Pararhizobium mangrovi]